MDRKVREIHEKVVLGDDAIIPSALKLGTAWTPSGKPVVLLRFLDEDSDRHTDIVLSPVMYMSVIEDLVDSAGELFNILGMSTSGGL